MEPGTRVRLRYARRRSDASGAEVACFTRSRSGKGAMSATLLRTFWNVIATRVRALRGVQPPFLYISWTEQCSRSDYTAAALGGLSFFPFVRIEPERGRLIKWCTLAFQALWTWAILLKHHPKVTIVRSPPVHGIFTVWLFTALFGGKLATDNHTATYASPHWRRFLFLQRWLERRAAFNIVAVPALKQLVEANGGRAILVPDVPLDVAYDTLPATPAADGPPKLVVPCSYNPDEPIREILAAASLRPQVCFVFTGRAEKLAPELRATAPANVLFTGFIARSDYVSLVRSASAVLALTTRNQTMQRAAWEAIYLGRPVMTTSWPVLRESFAKGAVFVANDAAAIAQGIDALLSEHARFEREAFEARSERLARWQLAKREIVAAAAASPIVRSPLWPVAMQNSMLSEIFTHELAQGMGVEACQDSTSETASPLISVIVPVRDNPDGVRELLACLAVQTTRERFEILIGDDGSRPGLEPSPEGPGVSARVLPELPLTSYAARNRAARAARGRVFAFCDSDCRPDPNWLEEALAALRKADIVAGEIIFWTPCRPSRWALLTMDMFFDQLRNVHFARGVTANLVITRDVFERLGGFDESLPSGGDYDLLRRAADQGARLRYARRAVVRHPTLENTRSFLRKIWFTNRWAAARSARAGAAPGLIAILEGIPILGVALARRQALRPAFSLDRPRLRACGITPTWCDDLRILPLLYLLVAPIATLAQLRGWLDGVWLASQGTQPVYGYASAKLHSDLGSGVPLQGGCGAARTGGRS